MKISHVYHTFCAHRSDLLKASSTSALKIGDVKLAEQIISAKCADLNDKLAMSSALKKEHTNEHKELALRFARLSLGLSGMISMPILNGHNDRISLGDKGMDGSILLKDQINIDAMLCNKYSKDSVWDVKDGNVTTHM